MELAIDRFRAKGLPPQLEAKAQSIAAELAGPGASDPNFLLGYLDSSVARALERPRLLSRDRLAVDLRVVDLLRARR